MRQGEVALYGVSLKVPAGKRTAIIGERSQLMQCVTHLISLDQCCATHIDSHWLLHGMASPLCVCTRAPQLYCTLLYRCIYAAGSKHSCASMYTLATLHSTAFKASTVLLVGAHRALWQHHGLLLHS
jgi:hypothetical protein